MKISKIRPQNVIVEIVFVAKCQMNLMKIKFALLPNLGAKILLSVSILIPFLDSFFLNSVCLFICFFS